MRLSALILTYFHFFSVPLSRAPLVLTRHETEDHVGRKNLVVAGVMNEQAGRGLYQDLGARTGTVLHQSDATPNPSGVI